MLPLNINFIKLKNKSYIYDYYNVDKKGIGELQKYMFTNKSNINKLNISCEQIYNY
jgi:hypothetical protein